MTKPKIFQRYSIDLNGWGFAPHGGGNAKFRTPYIHYFFNSDKSLCGRIILDDHDKVHLRFTESKNLMSFTLCGSCKLAIKRIIDKRRLKEN